MSEPKHTPGPWAAFSDEINDHTNIVSIADRTRLVLSLPGRHKSDPDVRLIAAAPDLLEALEDAVRTCESDQQHILDNGRLRGVMLAALVIAKGSNYE